MHAIDSPAQLVGIGMVSKELGICRQRVRDLEAAGIIPPATRIEPGSRRVWPATQLAEISDRVRAFRERHTGNQPAT